jgi:hypothetical protein
MKELLKPQMIRILDSLKQKIKNSALKNSQGNFNKEIRRLIYKSLLIEENESHDKKK